MLSTRRDLFPPMIADQLAILQDRVALHSDADWVTRKYSDATGEAEG
jgi:predicted unusual protein kinase regulating ubiquinone biosynthesis (AarF/ABC1/UbiB family)